MTCGRRLYQCDWYFACIPVGNVCIGLDLSALETLHDAVPFMLVPVCDQNRFAVLRFDQIFQCVQLAVVDANGLAAVIVNCTVRHLGMYPHHVAAIGINRTAGKLCQLSTQDTCICCCNGIPHEVQTHILFHIFVNCRSLLIKFHSIRCRYQLRHGQVVDGFHGDADISDFAVYFLFRTLSRCVSEAVPVRCKISITILSDTLAETFTLVQQTELRPQIHESVAAWCSGQPYDALYERSYLP